MILPTWILAQGMAAQGGKGKGRGRGKAKVTANTASPTPPGLDLYDDLEFNNDLGKFSIFTQEKRFNSI